MRPAGLDDSAHAELKYQGLATRLRRAILAGTWPIGSKLPTEVQLMGEYGLSLTTVRRAFEELVEEGLVVRRRGAGSFVARPRELDDPPPTTLGVLIPDTHLYYGRVLQGIEDHCSAVGVGIRMATSAYDRDREASALTTLLSSDTDALILVPILHPLADEWANATRFEALASLDRPVVFIERRPRLEGAAARLEYVVSDHGGGAYDAISHLVGLGHSRIGLVLRIQRYTGRQVKVGYDQACADHGVEPVVFEAAADEWGSGKADAALDHLAEHRCTAALVFGDREANMLVGAAFRRGTPRIPSGLALVSYDDELADLADIPLTAMAPAKHRLGVLAAELALQRLREGQTRPLHQIQLRPRLIVRASCGATVFQQPGSRVDQDR